MSEVLLPPNATDAERALEGTVARVGDVPPDVRTVWNPDTSPSGLLPWMAWAFSLDTWDPNWSDAQKRAAIKNAVAAHRYKGTIGAVRDALAALGFDADVVEWFNKTPAGAPYTFDLVISTGQTGTSQLDQQHLVDVAASAKNLRSHLGAAFIAVTTLAPTYIGGTTLMGNELTVPWGGNAVNQLVLDGTYPLDGSQTLDGAKN